jgi:hypothetical protein
MPLGSVHPHPSRGSAEPSRDVHLESGAAAETALRSCFIEPRDALGHGCGTTRNAGTAQAVASTSCAAASSAVVTSLPLITACTACAST